ncbi:MAG TPA: DegV family protein [Anaerolineae bacterium]|nr:DegV family protein [Anaerolineae bacterium]
MATTRIITDASSYLRPEVVSRYKITVLPLEVSFGKGRFRIDPEDPESHRRVFDAMDGCPAQPTEAVFAPDDFPEAYERLSREAQEILVILGSGRLSDGVAKAQAATRPFRGRCRIMVMDSLSSSWGLGLVVESAARAAEAGLPLDGLVRLVRALLPHIYTVFFVERLDYLEQKRKIGAAQALLGTILRIKPILLVEDGDVVPMEKVRTRAAAIEKLADFVGEFATPEKVVILRSPLEDGMDEMVADLRRHLAEVLPRRQFPVLAYDPVLACYVGPQALGVLVYERH